MMDRLSKETIWYHINTDTPEGKKLRAEYKLKGIPTVVLLDSKGQEIDRIIGYDDRSSWMKNYLASLFGVDTLGDYLARAGSGGDAELCAKIAQKYLDRGEAPDALSWVAKARVAKEGQTPELAARLGLMEGLGLLATEPAEGEKRLLAIAADPKSGDAGQEAFDALARAYKKGDRNKDLEALFDKVMAFKGDDKEFLNDYAWTFAERGIALPKALAAAKKAVELSKEDPGILDTLAEVYFKMGQKDLAISTEEKAIAKAPDDKSFQDQKEKFLKDGEKKDNN
jgi:tetratricopeptide (TPR) repeat protein